MFGFSRTQRALGDTITISELKMVFPLTAINMCVCVCHEMLQGPCGPSLEPVWVEYSLSETRKIIHHTVSLQKCVSAEDGKGFLGQGCKQM